MLARAEEFAGAAELQVALGNFETVGRCYHSFDSLARIPRDGMRRNEDALGFFGAAADAPAELVNLRESETIGMLDNHHSGVWNIHANFDHGCSYENLQLTAAETFHHCILLVVFQPAVEQAHAHLRKYTFCETLIFRRGGFQLLF